MLATFPASRLVEGKSGVNGRCHDEEHDFCNYDVRLSSPNIKIGHEPRAGGVAAMRFRACPCRIDAYIDRAFDRVCLGRYASWLQ